MPAGISVSRTPSIDCQDIAASTMPRKKLRNSTTSSIEEQQKGIVERYKKGLDQMICGVKKEIERKKRFRPHMSIEQLELAILVWNCVTLHPTVEKAIADMALDFDTSHHKLIRFLQGDEKQYVGASHQKIIEKKLSEWLKKKNSKLYEPKEEATIVDSEKKEIATVDDAAIT
jgi:hypothetical protein